MAGQGADPGEEDILAVVPTLNEARHIEGCLAALLGGSEAPAGFQLIVADGGSTDGTQAIVEGLASRIPNLHLIDNPVRLQAAALNEAVRRKASPRHTILVRCDAHSTYPPGFVMGVATSLRHAGADSIAVPMDAMGETSFGKAVAAITDTRLGSGGSAHRGGGRSHWVDHGHHAAFDLARFCQLGGYDETFAHNEDAEYDRRLTEAGGRIWLDAEWRIGVVARGTLGALMRQYFRYGKGRTRTVMKHRMRPRLRQMVPVLHVIALLVSALLVPLGPIGLAYPLLYGCLLIGAMAWGFARLGLAGLWCGAALGMIHTAWGLGFLTQIMIGSRKVGSTPELRSRTGVT